MQFSRQPPPAMFNKSNLFIVFDNNKEEGSNNKRDLENRQEDLEQNKFMIQEEKKKMENGKIEHLFQSKLKTTKGIQRFNIHLNYIQYCNYSGQRSNQYYFNKYIINTTHCKLKLSLKVSPSNYCIQFLHSLIVDHKSLISINYFDNIINLRHVYFFCKFLINSLLGLISSISYLEQNYNNINNQNDNKIIIKWRILFKCFYSMIQYFENRLVVDLKCHVSQVLNVQ
ncbi:hypothetical protein pb186bvf_000755 [Paramecium bursaria]